MRFSGFGYPGGLSDASRGGAPTIARLALGLALISGCGGPQVGSLTLPEAPEGDAGPLVAESLAADGGADGAALSNTAPADDEATASQDSEEVDDGAEASEEGHGQIQKHPLDNWTKEQIAAALDKDPTSLGSMSIGYTNSGALYNGVQMPPGEPWVLVNADHAWGTRETVDNLTRCLNRVSQQFPGSPKMYIGHISGRRGGHLSPHKSHQCGRDVDISYYYVAGTEKWYATANAKNLDRERTWAFVRTIIADTDVEMILMDRSVQRLVRQYAISKGEDREWVDRLFDGGGGLPPLIRHAKGHATHLHLRFYNPLAQETGRRSYEILIKKKVLSPPSYFVNHKAKSGDTLSELAVKFHVPAKTIQQINGMKNEVLKIGRDYKIPQSGGVRTAPRVTIPPRRVPPETTPQPVPNAGNGGNGAA
ncbi:MAG: penicillin-insensitive murein endopeptidase [Polyangiaceae bacterium]